MKNSWKWALGLMVSGLLVLGLMSCSQYEDNESVSLVSKTERISQAWRVQSYSVDSLVVTPLMVGYKETFTKEGSYSFQWELLGGTGSWAFQNGSAEVKITNVNNVTSRTLTILRLETGAFWYYYMDGDVRTEVHLIPQ